jgi:hypothetical protein
MSRPIVSLVSLVLAAALVLQGCAGGASANHRRGILLAGGTAVFIGTIIAIDGLSCDESFGGGNGIEDCEEDKADLITGGATLGVGLVLLGLGLLLEKQAEAKATPATAPVASDAKRSEPAPKTETTN